MQFGRRAVFWFAIASALLHWLLYLRVPALPSIAAKEPSTIEFSVIEESAPPAMSAPTPPPSAATAEPVGRRMTHRTTAVVAVPALDATASAPTELPTAAAEPNPRSGASGVGAPAAPTPFSLSPRSAANTLADSLAPNSAGVCGSRLGSAAISCEHDDREATAQAELNRVLKQAAQAHPYLAKREPPSLQREHDGSYRFAGPVFQARIAQDGHVSFEDRGQVRLSSGGAQIGFDLTDAADALAKHELYSAEKQWFLDQTVALRDQLATSSRIAERAQTGRQLERELARILGSSEDVARKHAALFALWQDCSADDEGSDVRRAVERFIRSRLPLGSPLAFSADEIERLNRQAGSEIRFDPYRG